MITTASKVKKGILALLLLLAVSIGYGQVSIQSNGKHSSVTIEKNGLNSFKIDYKGEIAISDDDKDVTAISPGGYIEISKTNFGSKREIRLEGTSSGLTRAYYVGRQKVEWNPEGKNWLAEILPEVVRSTGIGAESRVERFYKKGGVSAVINELMYIDSDYVEAKYANILLNKSLKNTEIAEALKGIANEIDSDYYLASVLKDNSRKMLKGGDEVATAYFEAIEEIGSDYYAAEVLKDALEEGDFSGPQIAAIIEAAKEIGSDYYMASVFEDVVRNSDVSDELIIAILKATDDIDSDHYQSAVLKEVMSRDNNSPAVQNALMGVIGNISSDHYMTEVLEQVLSSHLSDESLAEVLRIVRDEMSSDHYAGVVLGEVANHQKLNDVTIQYFADAVMEMSSDHYAAQALSEMARENLTDNQVKVLLRAATEINSDHYLTEVLVAFSDRVNSGSADLKDEYRKAAKTIDSETYYGRAVKAID